MDDYKDLETVANQIARTYVRGKQSASGMIKPLKKILIPILIRTPVNQRSDCNQIARTVRVKHSASGKITPCAS